MRKWLEGFFKNIAVTIMFGVIFYSSTVAAADPADPTRWKIPDISAMIQNLAASIPNLMQFVTALAYVMGMYFVIEGILKLKKYGESRTAGGDASLKAPLIYMGVGAALMFLPSSVQVGLQTFWQTPTPYSYLTSDDVDPWVQLMQSIFMIVQLIGTIAFIRGLIILNHLGSGQASQQGGFGKAMAHMIGGIFCINIYQFIQVITSTFGLGKVL